MNSYRITENGFLVDGSGKVEVPECIIKADSFIQASNKLTAFLETKQLTEDIELVTPFEKISFSLYPPL